MVSSALVIVGAGHAGAELAFATRQAGWSAPILLIGEETELPYHRPPLSKAYLSGEAGEDAFLLRPQSAYEKMSISLELGKKVAKIDRPGHKLLLDDGSEIGYAKLALCTGGTPRSPRFSGLENKSPSNLYTLRTKTDSRRIGAALQDGAKVVIVGGGYIGLEIAASARKRGAQVTLIEAQDRVLSRVTGPEMSAFYQEVHSLAGCDIRTGVTVERVECDESGAVRALYCGGDPNPIGLDVLIVGIGMIPNVGLAQDADLEVDGGIVVDSLSRTSDPDIIAAGDCTVSDHELYGRRLRLESVPNALEQARAAASLLNGSPKPNCSIPWFWSDQYDLKLQIVGISTGYDRCVLRGTPASRCFTAFYLKAARLIAAESVNRQADFMAAKRLVASDMVFDPGLLADESVHLKDLLKVSEK